MTAVTTAASSRAPPVPLRVDPVMIGWGFPTERADREKAGTRLPRPVYPGVVPTTAPCSCCSDQGGRNGRARAQHAVGSRRVLGGSVVDVANCKAETKGATR